MKIGFDLDKVFIDYPPFIPDSVIDRLYLKKANGTLVYRYPSKAEQVIRKLSHYPLLRPPIQKNIDFLKQIAGKKDQLYLISSRFGFLEENTKALVEKYGFDKIFKEMYFNYKNEQPHLFKEKVLKKLELDIYVDDDLNLLKYVAKNNSKTEFYWLNGVMKKTPLSPHLFAIPDLSCIINP